jgi:SNF2 family DNA or RNA helicase
MEYTFKTVPYEHQVHGFAAFVKHDTPAILWDAGLGKTFCVINGICARHLLYRQSKWVVACPLTAMDTWRNELAKFCTVPYTIHDFDGTVREKAVQIRNLYDSDDLDGIQIILLSFGSLSSNDTGPTKTVRARDVLVRELIRWNPDGVIVDESHLIKNYTSARTKSLVKLGEIADVRCIMTGTVNPKNRLDIFGQWLFLNPDRFGKNFNAFKVRYAVWGGFLGKQPIRFINQNEMQDRIGKDAYVARKRDCLDLPPVTEQIVPVVLSTKERDKYVEMARDFLVEFDEDGTIALAGTAAVKAIRLQQITSGFINFEDDSGKVVTRRIGQSKLNTLVDLVDPLVDAGEKVVVFAHFRYDIQSISRKLALLYGDKVKVWWVDGSTDREKRRKILKSFSSDPGSQVIVAQQATMGLSVNELVVSSNAIFYSMSYKRDEFDQAIARLDRSGQTKPVTIRHLIVQSSIDEVILASNHRKQSFEHALLKSLKKSLDQA